MRGARVENGYRGSCELCRWWGEWTRFGDIAESDLAEHRQTAGHVEMMAQTREEERRAAKDALAARTRDRDAEWERRFGPLPPIT